MALQLAIAPAIARLLEKLVAVPHDPSGAIVRMVQLSSDVSTGDVNCSASDHPCAGLNAMKAAATRATIVSEEAALRGL
jgi:hypothetical protein